MRVLLFSTVVYLAGIATVLFLRPALMFDREGRWKEFGLRGDDTTVFPFWFFCIGWAVVSYLVAGLLTLDDAGATSLSAAARAAIGTAKAASLTTAASGLFGSFKEEEEAGPRPSNAVMPLPVSGPSAKKGGGRGKGRRSQSSPPPKGYYLYVGGEMPADTSDSEEEASN